MSKEPDPTSPWLRIGAAASYLAVTRRHLTNLVAAGELPAYRRGRCTWLARADLDDYIRAGAVEPAA